jgi:hypothetical protein
LEEQSQSRIWSPIFNQMVLTVPHSK